MVGEYQNIVQGIPNQLGDRAYSWGKQWPYSGKQAQCYTGNLWREIGTTKRNKYLPMFVAHKIERFWPSIQCLQKCWIQTKWDKPEKPWILVDKSVQSRPKYQSQRIPMANVPQGSVYFVMPKWTRPNYSYVLFVTYNNVNEPTEHVFIHCAVRRSFCEWICREYRFNMNLDEKFIHVNNFNVVSECQFNVLCLGKIMIWETSNILRNIQLPNIVGFLTVKFKFRLQTFWQVVS